MLINLRSGQAAIAFSTNIEPKDISVLGKCWMTKSMDLLTGPPKAP